MADREKVIKGLKLCASGSMCIGRDCPYWHNVLDDAIKECDCTTELIRDALTLLKEQEAVEPILKRKGKSKMYNDYVCPVCDNEVVYEQCYCSECGKPFLWEGR